MERETAIESEVRSRRRFLSCAFLPAAAAGLGAAPSPPVRSTPERDRLERLLREHGGELGEIRRLPRE
jgi:hypothetical protein